MGKQRQSHAPTASAHLQERRSLLFFFFLRSLCYCACFFLAGFLDLHGVPILQHDDVARPDFHLTIAPSPAHISTPQAALCYHLLHSGTFVHVYA